MSKREKEIHKVSTSEQKSKGGSVLCAVNKMSASSVTVKLLPPLAQHTCKWATGPQKGPPLVVIKEGETRAATTFTKTLRSFIIPFVKPGDQEALVLTVHSGLGI